MRPPDSGSDELLPHEPRERPWARITPSARIISLLFFGLFLYGLARDTECPVWWTPPLCRFTLAVMPSFGSSG